MTPNNLSMTSLTIIMLLFFSCTSSPRYGQYSSVKKTPRLKKSSRLQNPADIKTKGIKHRKIMNGVSSFYAEDFHGKLTANGEIYDMYGCLLYTSPSPRD